MTHLRFWLPALALLAVPALGACTQNASDAVDEPDRTISVESSDDACELSATEAPSGSLTFDVTNTGERVTEFYLYADGGDRVAGEVENIGPGVSREMVVVVDAGEYLAACKPGMEGDGIRIDFTVAD